jgi:hypothetical protein
VINQTPSYIPKMCAGYSLVKMEAESSKVATDESAAIVAREHSWR